MVLIRFIIFLQVALFCNFAHADDLTAKINDFINRGKIEFKKSKTYGEKGMWCTRVAYLYHQLYLRSKNEADLLKAKEVAQKCHKFPLSTASQNKLDAIGEHLENSSAPMEKYSVSDLPAATTTSTSTLNSASNSDSEVKETIAENSNQSVWPLSLSYWSWHDKFHLVGGGTKIELISPVSGLSLGLGWEKKSNDWGWALDVSLFYGKVNFGNSNSNDTQTANQENVSMIGLMTIPAVNFYLADQFFFTIGTPIFLGQADYTEPAGYSYDEKTKKQLGILFKSTYAWSDFRFSLASGRWIDDQYLIWQTEFSYLF